MPELTEKQDRALAMTDPNQLLDLDFLQVDQIENSLHAYQLAKRANEKRVMGEAVKWGKRGARINAIAPGIIVTPLALDEFNGPRGDFYKNMFANSPAGRPGAADEVDNLAELVLSEQAAYMTGSTLLIDGGATAYKNMFANSPAGRPGAADEVDNLAELVLSEQAAYMTGSTLLIDGGATASYFYGPLQPNKES